MYLLLALFLYLKIVEKYSNSNIDIHTFNQVLSLFLLHFIYLKYVAAAVLHGNW
jgi:hypothetical protein